MKLFCRVATGLLLTGLLLLGGCAGSALSPDAQKGIRRVGVISAIGDTMLMMNSPFFRWDMFELAYPIDQMDLDTFVTTEIAKQLEGKYEIVPVSYKVSDFQERGSISSRMKAHPPGADVDVYLVVAKADTGYGNTAVIATGLGVIRAISGSHYYAHAIYGIAVIDAKTNKELAVQFASDKFQSAFEGSFYGHPNREVTEAYWYEGEGPLPEAQKALLKPEFERLIQQSLPETLQALKLIPGPTP